MKTTTYIRGMQRFDMVGRSLSQQLHEEKSNISRGLAWRLNSYAKNSLRDNGFHVDQWETHVYTLDGDEKPKDRFYCVEFKNKHGGRIGVEGILTRNGWPFLDHGLFIRGKDE